MIKYIYPLTKNILDEDIEKKILTNSQGDNTKIINSIPRFVDSSLDEVDYAQIWGDQWEKYQLTQFDSVNKADFSKKRIEFILGEPIENLKDLDVFEAGCGAGRFTELFLKSGANLHSIDASKAVDFNYKNNAHKSNKFQIAQADLFNPPYPDNSFDLVVCVGVLQHTPNTVEAINILWKKVKPGGKLIIDHYQFLFRYYFSLLEVFRFFVKKMPPEKSIKFCKSFIKIFFPLFWKIRNNKILIKILRKIIPVGFGSDEDLNELSYTQRYELAELETHDALADTIKRLITKKKLKEILKNLKNSNIDMIVDQRQGSNGIEARISKISK